MSKHNYTQYANKRNNHNPKPKKTPAPERFVEPVKAEPIKWVEETVDTVMLPDTIEGIVTNCAKLNVRAEPSLKAEVVCVLDTMSEIEINLSQSNDEWFKVCTAIGVEGYCMRKYIQAQI